MTHVIVVMAERVSHFHTRRSGGLWAGGANWLRRLAMGLLIQTETRGGWEPRPRCLQKHWPGRGAQSGGKLEVGGEDGVGVTEHSNANA